MIPENGSRLAISEGESCRCGKLHLPFARWCGLDEGLAHPGRKFGASGVNLSKEPVKPHEAETDDKIGYWSQSCLKDGE